MSRIERILAIFVAVTVILFVLFSAGILPLGVVSQVVSASMLLTWLIILSQVFMFPSADTKTPAASAVFQGSSDGEWLPVVNGGSDGIWIRRMPAGEKRDFLLHLKQSDDEERAQAWANLSIGWKGHCITGVNGWKGNRCDSRELLPYSRDAVYSCCLRNPDLFAHYAGRLQKTL